MDQLSKTGKSDSTQCLHIYNNNLNLHFCYISISFVTTLLHAPAHNINMPSLMAAFSYRTNFWVIFHATSLFKQVLLELNIATLPQALVFIA
jgi:hypothetical protein